MHNQHRPHRQDYSRKQVLFTKGQGLPASAQAFQPAPVSQHSRPPVPATPVPATTVSAWQAASIIGMTVQRQMHIINGRAFNMRPGLPANAYITAALP